jgi:uncharacterized protein YggU (UPF0235/DUF167 family)
VAAARSWRTGCDGLEIRVRVTPRGGRDALEGVAFLADGGEIVKLRVRSMASGGAANEAARQLLARVFRRPASAVTLTAGATARVKTFFIEGEPDVLAERAAEVLREHP